MGTVTVKAQSAVNGRAPASAAPAAVAALELCKRIDGRPILLDVNFELLPGRFAVLLGANGAGKTTLLKVLAMLTPTTSGELRLFGEPAGREGSTRLRARIGLIGHQPMLYGDLSARENLEFFARLYDIPDPRDRAERMLERVGLLDRADDPIKAFSRGMTQRAAIARALLHEPELLLADEPFAGLDAPSNRMLEELLGELHAEGRSIVLAHHDIEQGLRIAEQAVVLRAGRVVVDRPTRLLDVRTTIQEMAAA